ncbi:MAG: SLC13 family permease [Alphaproteobacteria bacterium]
MTVEQTAIVAIVAATVAMFIWGRWRHDMVALGALLACVFAGLVTPDAAFAGFGHPAVVTVACVLILSRGLQTSGAVDALTQRILPASAGSATMIAALTGLAATLSAFMNNVGALALLMPVAIQVAERQGLPPGRILMPVAFGSILGGMVTLIGTPPNLIVSGFRAQTGAGSFAMFDFAPVGLAVAAAGVAFIALIGWRLVPARERAGTEGFDTGTYLTEARLPEKCKAVGMTMREIEAVLDESDAQAVGLVRREIRVPVPHGGLMLRAGDILVIEADPKALATVLSNLGLKLEEEVAPTVAEENERTADAPAAPEAEQAQPASAKPAATDDIALAELAPLPDSHLIGRSASDIRLRSRFGINLLAVSRQGRRSMARLRTMPLRGGDVLLMQGAPDALADFASQFRCVPLASRPLRIPNRRDAILSGAVMAAATAGAAFGLLPAAIAFAAGALVLMATRVVPPRTVYDAVDWSVVVLLGAMIPVAEAMAGTGAADMVARAMLDWIAQGNAVAALILVLVVTMTLSDFMNNAATAAVMCPIAIGVAGHLGVGSDAFLMAVAVGASCAFLTPIGHQNNTLILGPGGFRFGDYWRLGLPLELMVIAVAIPLLLAAWPL